MPWHLLQKRRSDLRPIFLHTKVSLEYHSCAHYASCKLIKHVFASGMVGIEPTPLATEPIALTARLNSLSRFNQHICPCKPQGHTPVQFEYVPGMQSMHSAAEVMPANMLRAHRWSNDKKLKKSGSSVERKVGGGRGCQMLLMLSARMCVP